MLGLCWRCLACKYGYWRVLKVIPQMSFRDLYQMKIWPVMTRAPFQQSLLFNFWKQLEVDSRQHVTTLLSCISLSAFVQCHCILQPVTPSSSGAGGGYGQPAPSGIIPSPHTRLALWALLLLLLEMISISNSRNLRDWNRKLFWNLCVHNRADNRVLHVVTEMLQPVFQ